jgi:hypothetical protein
LPDAESFFALVNPHLKAVDDFVSHEISYAEATGDLASGEFTAEDIVDAALLRAHQEFVENPARGEARSWLMKLVVEQVDSEIKRSIIGTRPHGPPRGAYSRDASGRGGLYSGR